MYGDHTTRYVSVLVRAEGWTCSGILMTPAPPSCSSSGLRAVLHFGYDLRGRWRHWESSAVRSDRCPPQPFGLWGVDPAGRNVSGAGQHQTGHRVLHERSVRHSGCNDQKWCMYTVLCFTGRIDIISTSPPLPPAIRYDPTNVRYLWERSNLHMRLGEQKHCMDGYRKILLLLPLEEGEHFMQLSKDMAK